MPLSDVVNSVGSLALNVSTLDSVLAGDGTQSEHGTGAGAGAAGGTNGYEGSRPSRPAARGTAHAVGRGAARAAGRGVSGRGVSERGGTTRKVAAAVSKEVRAQARAQARREQSS